MKSFPLINGYAAPFDRLAVVDGGVIETIQPSAFFVIPKCELQFGHDGPVLASNVTGKLRLWQDEFGLAFSADISGRPYDLATVRAVRREGLQCSVNFKDWRVDETVRDGQVHRRIVWACIDHIALAHGAAYGDGTGAWMADEPLQNLRGAARQLARQWADGRMTDGVTRPLVTNRVQPAGAHPVRQSVPISLRNLMNSETWTRWAAAGPSARAARAS
jgi:hypothetical protein